MKLKKILSSVVATAMAVSTFSVFAVTGNAATTSANILAADIEVVNWESPAGVIAKNDITSGDISTTGADSLILEGEWIDSTHGYASIKVCCYPAPDYQQVVLYENNVDSTFTVEVPLIGNYDVNLQGFNYKITSAKYVDSDVNISLSRGVQEATTSVGGTNDMDVATGITLNWNGTNEFPASTFANLRFDGTESLVFSSTGTGNVTVASNGPWTEYYSGGIWNANTSIAVPLTADMKDKALIFNGSATVDVKVVDNGSKAIRFVLKVAEEDVADIDSASLKLRNGTSYSDELTTSKCYKAIKANGNTISEDGYVYITFTIKNAPGNFSYDEAIFYFDGEKAATILG